MDFSITFAINTGGDPEAEARIHEIITSIEAQRIPDYEVLVVGGAVSTIERARTRHVAFDETLKPAATPFITAKKNLATREATKEMVAYLHDYHVFMPNWYPAMQAFGLDYDVAMNRVEFQDGTRGFDWLIYRHPVLPPHMPVPYDRTDLLAYQYLSGGYWVSKREVLLQHPLDERIDWGQEEDVEWTRRILSAGLRVVMIPDAVVRHNKPHRELRMRAQRQAAFAPHVGFFEPDPALQGSMRARLGIT